MPRSEIRRAYDAIFRAPGGLSDTPSLYSWVIKELSVRADHRLLDIGTGEGALLCTAREHGLLPVGIDISLTAAWATRQRIGAGLVSLADGENLPFAAASFDRVTSLGSLEHFRDVPQGIRQIRRVLRQDGEAAILLPNSYYLIDILWRVWRTGYGPDHKQPIQRFATFGEWKDLLARNGLHVLRWRKYNFRIPRSQEDIRWYRAHPRKLVNLLVAPFLPLHFSYHFLFFCGRG